MGAEKIIADLPRPFANYDIVVYFGGGLFSLPFLNRYVLEPFDCTFPKFAIPLDNELASQTVTILSMLFSIYIAGHLLAYAGSQIIEKTVDRVFGKVSSAILVSLQSSPAGRNEAIRALIYDRLKRIRAQRALVSSFVRIFFHLPIFIHYFLSYIIGIFGYYDTRLTRDTMNCIRKLYAEKFSKNRIGIRTQWYKPIEYYVISNDPSATLRMYNYLIISGLFRTLSVVFLISSWLLLYYNIHLWIDGDWMLKTLMNKDGKQMALIEYAFTSTICLFCIFSYMKFQRRYAEEALFAFAYSERLKS